MFAGASCWSAGKTLGGYGRGNGVTEGDAPHFNAGNSSASEAQVNDHRTVPAANAGRWGVADEAQHAVGEDW
jgi:hypothetical protein